MTCSSFCKKIERRESMAEGLRPHYHQDKIRHIIVKKIQYMCMICGRIRHEKYDCYVPPPKSKTKSLERNKKKYGNRG